MNKTRKIKILNKKKYWLLKNVRKFNSTESKPKTSLDSIFTYKKVYKNFTIKLECDLESLNKYERFLELKNQGAKLSSVQRAKSTIFQSVKTSIKNGCISSTCGYKDEQGRLSFLKIPNLQTIPAQLRDCLVGKNYIELDVRQCHPTIYYHLVSTLLSFPMPLFEKFLYSQKELSEYLKTPIQELKLTVLTILNGGSIKNRNSSLDKFIAELQDARYVLWGYLEDYQPDLLASFSEKAMVTEKKSFNIQSKIINRFLRLIESNILDVLLNGIFQERFENLNVIPLHDGLILPKNILTPDLIPNLEMSIRFYLGIDVKLSIKEIQIPPLDLDQPEVLNSPDWISLSSQLEDQIKNSPDSNSDLGPPLDLGFDHSDEESNSKTLCDSNIMSYSKPVINSDLIKKDPEQFLSYISQQISDQAQIHEIKSDYTLAKKIVGVLSNLGVLIKDSEHILWLFHNGIWISNQDLIKDYLIYCVANSTLGYFVLNPNNLEETDFLLRDNISYLKKVVDYAIALLPTSNKWMFEIVKKGSLNKFLLKCGNVYCFDSKEFRPFNPEIDFFSSKVNITKEDLLRVTQNDIEAWKELYFNKTYNEEDLSFLFHWLATSISGINAFWKNSLFVIGGRDSGKSVLLALLDRCFESLVASHINGGHFQQTKSTQELERSMIFCKNFYYQRLATVSEFESECPFNEKIIKMIQGMESVWCRILYKEAVRVPICTSLLFVNNSLVLGSPELYNHINILEAPQKFTISQDKDIGLIEKLTTPSGMACFIRILMESWSDRPMSPSEGMVSLKENLLKTDISRDVILEDQIFEKYFVCDLNSYVTVDQLSHWITKHNDLKIKLYSLIKLLKSKGATNDRIMVKGSRIRVILGVGFRHSF